MREDGHSQQKTCPVSMQGSNVYEIYNFFFFNYFVLNLWHYVLELVANAFFDDRIEKMHSMEREFTVFVLYKCVSSALIPI